MEDTYNASLKAAEEVIETQRKLIEAQETRISLLEKSLSTEKTISQLSGALLNMMIEITCKSSDKNAVPGRVPRGELPSETPSPAR